MQHGVQEGGDEAEGGRVGGGRPLGHLRQTERQPRVHLRVAELTRQRQTVIRSVEEDRSGQVSWTYPSVLDGLRRETEGQVRSAELAGQRQMVIGSVEGDRSGHSR